MVGGAARQLARGIGVVFERGIIGGGAAVLRGQGKDGRAFGAVPIGQRQFGLFVGQLVRPFVRAFVRPHRAARLLLRPRLDGRTARKRAQQTDRRQGDGRQKRDTSSLFPHSFLRDDRKPAAGAAPRPCSGGIILYGKFFVNYIIEIYDKLLQSRRKGEMCGAPKKARERARRTEKSAKARRPCGAPRRKCTFCNVSSF